MRASTSRATRKWAPGHQAQAGLSGSTAFAYRTTDNPGGAAMQGGY